MTTKAALTYGPVGDPESLDPFERAQARMPDGWHVEGQHLYGAYFASARGGHRFAWGQSPENLVANVVGGKQWYGSWRAVLGGAIHRENVG